MSFRRSLVQIGGDTDADFYTTYVPPRVIALSPPYWRDLSPEDQEELEGPQLIEMHDREVQTNDPWKEFTDTISSRLRQVDADMKMGINAILKRIDKLQTTIQSQHQRLTSLEKMQEKALSKTSTPVPAPVVDLLNFN